MQSHLLHKASYRNDILILIREGPDMCHVMSCKQSSWKWPLNLRLPLLLYNQITESSFSSFGKCLKSIAELSKENS